MTSNQHSIADHHHYRQQLRLEGLAPAARIRVLEDLKADNVLRLALIDKERDVLCSKIEDLARQIDLLRRAS